MRECCSLIGWICLSYHDNRPESGHCVGFLQVLQKCVLKNSKNREKNKTESYNVYCTPFVLEQLLFNVVSLVRALQLSLEKEIIFSWFVYAVMSNVP